MYLNKITPNIKPSFTSNIQNFWNDLDKMVPDTRVCDGLTYAHRDIFRQYMYSRPYKMGITSEEVAVLEKYDGLEFIHKSFEFLCDKLSIPKMIRPKMVDGYNLPDGVAAGYSASDNVIAINDKFLNLFSKNQMFMALRHELQHYIQNMKVLCHETIGPEIIDLRTRMYKESQKQSVINELKHKPLEQIKQDCDKGVKAGILYSDAFEMYKVVKFFMNTKNDKMIDKIFDEFSKNYKRSLEELRVNVIKEMGLIKSDSKLTPKIRQYAQDFIDLGYYNPDGSIDFGKYKNCEIEREAIFSHLMANVEYKQDGCFIKSRMNFLSDPEDFVRNFATDYLGFQM